MHRLDLQINSRWIHLKASYTISYLLRCYLWHLSHLTMALHRLIIWLGILKSIRMHPKILLRLVWCLYLYIALNMGFGCLTSLSMTFHLSRFISWRWTCDLISWSPHSNTLSTIFNINNILIMPLTILQNLLRSWSYNRHSLSLNHWTRYIIPRLLLLFLFWHIFMKY